MRSAPGGAVGALLRGRSTGPRPSTTRVKPRQRRLFEAPSGVLPFGTEAEVRDEVKRRIDAFAPGGGLVYATVHNVQALVPPENIVAVYDTVREYGRRSG
jgi:hypothetical protein